MKCTKFESNYSSCTRRSNENICRSSGGPHEKERQDETQFTTKTGGITCLGPQLFHFVKCFIPSYALMPYYAETGRAPPLIA